MSSKSHKLHILVELIKNMLPLLIFIIVYALSYLAFRHHYDINGIKANQSDLFYKSLRLFVVEGEINEPKISPFLNVMRFIAPLTTVMAAIAAFTALLGKRFKDLRLSSLKNHVVICGLGRKGNNLARHFQKDGRKVVVIDIDEDNEYLPIQKLSNIWTISGNATDSEILNKANLSSTSCLVIATGSDTTNVNILIHATNLIKHRSRSRPLNVILHMQDPDFCPLMRNKQVLKSIRDNFNLVVVNMYEVAAKDLFTIDMVKNMPVTIGATRRMHTVIAGFGNMGQAIALQAAKIGHFPNAVNKEDLKTLITIIDTKAAEAFISFKNRFPAFDQICDINLIEGEFPASDVQEKILTALEDKENLSSIFICYEDDYYNLKKALSLVPLLHKQKQLLGQTSDDIDIFVELSESEGLYHLLETENSNTDWARQLKGFMAVPDIFHIDEKNNSCYEIMAKVLAAFYENKFGIPISIEKAGWDNLSFRLQDSNIQAAHHIIIKLNALGYEPVPSTKGNFFSESKNSIFLPNKTIQLPITDNEKEILAKMEHNRWLAEIRLEGYSYGPAPANHELRTHPCCLPWEQLEEKERKKDLAQIDIIPVALLNAGFIPMKKEIEKLYKQLYPKYKPIFEDLAIGLLKEGQTFIDKSRKCDLKNIFNKSSSKKLMIITSSLGDELKKSQMTKNKLSSILSNFSGVVITGRITKSILDQIHWVTENLKKENQKQYFLLGYFPRVMSGRVNNSCYDYLIETGKKNYSELEPIQYWLDIVFAEINPKQVQFLYFKCGNDQDFELQLAEAIGAKTEILE